MPSVLPRTSKLAGRDLAPLPACISRTRSPRWRASMTTSAMIDLGDAARVRERRVEDRDAAPVGRSEIDLVGADAEAADREQPAGVREDARRVTRVLLRMPRTCTSSILARELVLGPSAPGSVSRWNPSRAEELVRARVDVLEQEDLDRSLGNDVSSASRDACSAVAVTASAS